MARRKRITRATLETYARTLGRDSLAARCLRRWRDLDRDGIRADIFMVTTGFHLQTVCHTYRFD